MLVIFKKNIFTILRLVNMSWNLDNTILKNIIKFKKIYKKYSGTGPRVIVSLGPTPYSKGPVPDCVICQSNMKFYQVTI